MERVILTVSPMHSED
jgi:hypothetical protein